MRDFFYKYETMLCRTDEEFVAMVKQANREGVFNSSWTERMVEIAERKIKLGFLERNWIKFCRFLHFFPK